MLFFGEKRKPFRESLIHAEDALQGNIKGIRCPFCHVSLIARPSMKEKPAHYTHRKRACKYVRHLRKLMYYFPNPEYWLYGLTKEELRIFNRLKRRRALMETDRFISYHKTENQVLLLGKETYYGGYEDLGKAKYDTVEGLLKRKLIQLYNHSWGADVFELSWRTQFLWEVESTLKEQYLKVREDWDIWWRDSVFTHWDNFSLLWIFRSVNDRIKEASFYLLKIIVNEKILYKTGTTILPYEQLEKWERRQAKELGSKIIIEPIYFCDTISLVEPLLRLKYKKYIYKIGDKKGYFDFGNKFKDFKMDLHQVILLSDQHKEKIRASLKNNDRVGKRGKESTVAFLAKPRSKEIISFLEDPEEVHSIRAISNYTGYAINTIRKVKSLWEAEVNND